MINPLLVLISFFAALSYFGQQSQELKDTYRRAEQGDAEAQFNLRVMY